MIEREKEFYCVECGVHVVAVVWIVGSPLLCGQCIHVPGWFNDPTLAELFDPGGQLAKARAGRNTTALDAEIERVIDRVGGNREAEDR